MEPFEHLKAAERALDEGRGVDGGWHRPTDRDIAVAQTHGLLAIGKMMYKDRAFPVVEDVVEELRPLCRCAPAECRWMDMVPGTLCDRWGTEVERIPDLERRRRASRS